MPICNVIGYSKNYSKTSGSLWKYYGYEPILTDTGTISNFDAADNSALFKFKQKKTSVTNDNNTKDVEITVPLKYLSRFLRTNEMPLIKSKFNFILTWFDKFVSTNDTKATTFALTDRKFYVLVVTSSAQCKTARTI